MVVWFVGTSKSPKTFSSHAAAFSFGPSTGLQGQISASLVQRLKIRNSKGDTCTMISELLSDDIFIKFWTILE